MLHRREIHSGGAPNPDDRISPEEGPISSRVDNHHLQPQETYPIEAAPAIANSQRIGIERADKTDPPKGRETAGARLTMWEREAAPEKKVNAARRAVPAHHGLEGRVPLPVEVCREAEVLVGEVVAVADDRSQQLVQSAY